MQLANVTIIHPSSQNIHAELMRPYFHKVAVPMHHSFSVRHDKLRNFGKLLHYHLELELHYTIKGRGIRLIGDNVSHFQEGEVILLGENLPHAWKGKEQEVNQKDESFVEAIVIQFSANCLGKNFFELPEAYLIPHIFEAAKKGLLILGESAELIKILMVQMTRAKHFERILLLLKILQILSEKEEVKTIASAHAFCKPNELESARLDNVVAHTLSHFKREINLEEIALIANLSVNSFCRYFKSMTNKTYLDFLNEVRISHACRMIMEDRWSARIVCYECGFNNVSNFYKHFKKYTGVTPFEYKQKYKKNVLPKIDAG